MLVACETVAEALYFLLRKTGVNPGCTMGLHPDLQLMLCDIEYTTCDGAYTFRKHQKYPEQI